MAGITAFEKRYGFPREAVHLGNWRMSPFNRWSFQNVPEVVPSAIIAPDPNAGEAGPVDAGWLLGRKVTLSQGVEGVEAFLRRSHTDALCVLRDGKVIGDWSAPWVRHGAPHLVFSISKSLTAILAGVLEGQGLFDPDAPVVRYLPEAEGSAYGTATCRHVLDMTVSLDFDEAYLEPESLFARYRQAMGWNPGGRGETLLPFLSALQPLPGEPHGRVFRYRSPNSDVLGLLVERASGERVPDLLRERLTGPLGMRGPVSITVDGAGAARTAGGVSMAPRDLARVGEMMRTGGAFDGRQIVPAAWVHDTITAGDREAWLRSDFVTLFAEGRYRNKWYQTGKGSFCAIGIHGQWLVVNPASRTVIVKMASQPEPIDDPVDQDNIAFFDAVIAAADAR